VDRNAQTPSFWPRVARRTSGSSSITGGQDDFRFDPAEVNVEAGQEITFVVTNEGQAAHEFLLGDEEEQMMAEGEGEHEGGHGGSEYEVLELDPGQTAEITVTFEDPGTILYGCHEPGHYDAGMVGTITVE
jgi:uncharacterized cupredoxin-like copper-binding protein